MVWLVWVAYDELPSFAFSLITNRIKKGAINAPILSADVKNDKSKEISQDTKSRNVQTERGRSAGSKFLNLKKYRQLFKEISYFLSRTFSW